MSNVAAGKDTDDEGKSLNDVEKVLNKMGIALRSAKGEWRSFEDVLDEVASKWKNFDQTKQSQIATAIAGVRQQENFRALMANYDEVSKLAKVAADSTGSATERMKTYLDSVEAKTNKLKASWEQFVMSLNQSESWGNVLEILSSVLDKLIYVDWEKVIATISAFAALFIAIKGIKSIATIIQAGGGLASLIAGLSGLAPVLLGIAAALTTVYVAWKSINTNTKKGYEDSKTKVKQLEDEKSTVDDLLENYKSLAAKSRTVGLTESEKNELKSISEQLVNQYGLEYEAIDSLTGAYVIGEDAIKSYYDTANKELEKSKAERDKAFNEYAKDVNKDLSYYQYALKAQQYGKDANMGYDQSIVSSSQKQKQEAIKELTDYSDYFYNQNTAKGVDYFKNLYTKAMQELSPEELGNKLNDVTAKEIGSFIDNYGTEIQKIQDQITTEQERYDKNGVRNLDEVKKHYQELSKELSVYQTMVEKGLITQEQYDKIASDFETSVNNNFDAKLLSISDSLGENSKDFDNLANNILETNKQFKQGKITIDDYIKKLDELDNALDLQKTFGGNQEAALNFFNSLGQQISDVMTILTTNYQQGMTKNSDYITQMQSLGNYMVSFAEKVSTLFPEETKDDEIYTNLGNDYIPVEEIKKSQITAEEQAVEEYNKYMKSLNLWERAFVDKDKLKGVMTQNASKYFEDTGNNPYANRKQYDNYLKQQYGSYAVDYYKEQIDSYDSNPNTLIENMSTPYSRLGDKSTALDEYNTQLEESNKKLEGLYEKREKLENKMTEIPDNITGNRKGGLSLFGIDSYQKSLESLSGDILDNYQELEKVNKDIAEYEGKKENAEENIKKLSGEIVVNEESAGEAISSGIGSIKNGLEDIKKYSDSFNLVDKIDTGEIQKGTAEFKQACLTISEDISSMVQNASEEEKSRFENIIVGNKKLSEMSQQEIFQALADGTLTMETAGALLENKMNTAFTEIKNGAAKFFDGLALAFKDFKVNIHVAWRINPIEGIKNTLSDLLNGGTSGLLIDLGQIETSTDAVSSGFSNIANTIRDTNTDIHIGSDSPYIPNKNNTKTGSTGNYSPAGSGSKKKKGSGSDYSAEDAASDLKDILNDIEKYEAEIELDLEDQTEELLNQYNLKKNQLDTLKEELDYYDSIYDVTENTTKWLDTQLKILDNQSKKVAEMQNSNEKIDKQRQKIYNENSKYNVKSWFDSEGNETLAYGDLLNSFEYRKNQIEKETADAMRAEYNKVANSTNKDTIKAAKDKIKQIEEEGDTKIKLIDKERTYVENVYDSVEQLNDAWKENQEAIREALQELNDRVKSIRDELIDDIMEQLEKAVDKMNKSLDKDVTRLEQLKEVQQSYNDILNDTIDTQQELEDELKANMDSYQYLDDTMRQLMFNEDDYKQLSGVIEGIQSDIASIWENHYNQIQNLTEDEMYKAEYITNETERQLAAKQKEYDLAKAELDVAKAQTNLNNVKNERNTRIFANGEWQWVANAENVRNAQQQLMEAEREKTKLEREAEQQLLINAMDKMIDSDNLQIDKNNELLENIQEAIEQETQEVKSIEEALMNADKANLPALTNTLIGALGSDGGYMKELLGEINHSQVELAAALRGQTIQQAVDQLKSGTMSQSDFEELTKRLGYSFNETTGMVTTQDGSFAAHYRGWTKKSNNATQLGTAQNGVQTTGGNAGAGQASAATSGGNGGGSTFPRNGRVSTSSLPLRIRSGAGTQYRILGTMPKGANVTILGESNSGWAQVRYGGITGYASRQYLSYDQGGIANGLGYMPKATLEPERVLSPRQTKAFEKLVNNITTNPVLNALSRVPSVNSKLGNLAGETNNSKNYYFSNFTVQADDIKQFINSIETIMPMKNK